MALTLQALESPPVGVGQHPPREHRLRRLQAVHLRAPLLEAS